MATVELTAEELDLITSALWEKRPRTEENRLLYERLENLIER